VFSVVKAFIQERRTFKPAYTLRLPNGKAGSDASRQGSKRTSYFFTSQPSFSHYLGTDLTIS
jgi:hypothetical protein